MLYTLLLAILPLEEVMIYVLMINLKQTVLIIVIFHTLIQVEINLNLLEVNIIIWLKSLKFIMLNSYKFFD